jgi:hypothetical protein
MVVVLFLLFYVGRWLLLHLEAGWRQVAMRIKGRKRLLVVASRSQVVVVRY